MQERRADDVLFPHQTYMLRRKALKLLGGSFTFYDPDGNPVLYADRKAFKLREDIRLYQDQGKTRELLRIKARKIIDWASNTYDVFDSGTDQHLGSFRRRGLTSAFVRDEWVLLTPDGQEYGTVQEDNPWIGLVRRYLLDLIPQSFEVQVGGTLAAYFRQRFNPFILKIEVDFSMDISRALDKRMGLAAALLMSAIEGRQG